MARIEVRTSKQDILEAAQAFRDAKNIIKQAQAEEEEARQILFEFMRATKAEKLTAGKNVIHIKEYTRTNVDINSMREDHPYLVSQYETKQTLYRMTVADV